MLRVDPFCPQILSIQSPETSTCVQLPLGTHYSAKIRAKPDGITYSGDWSDWSDVITGDTPADKSEVTFNCCVVIMTPRLKNLIFIRLFLKTFQAPLCCCVSPSACWLLPSSPSPCFPRPSGKNQVLLGITQCRPYIYIQIETFRISAHLHLFLVHWQ